VLAEKNTFEDFEAGQDLLQIQKRSVVIAGHRSSVSLENAFWFCLKEVAGRKGQTVNQLVTEIDSCRTGNLSSAIRVFILLEGKKC
jgi:predicted DNA-binding ribbon-helix-helix protein|tara:strand:- start:174 stop:431 length:258 start_codon:yes stop_codon:yes gene_type:complete